MRVSLGPTLVSFTLLAAFAGCPDEELAAVAPIIEIADPFNDAYDAICSLPADPGIDNRNGFRECQFNFGDVPVGQGRFFRFLIKNPSPVDLFISEIVLSDDSDPSMKLGDELPTLVAATDEDGVEVTVRYVPTVASTVSARLIIKSDAANLEEDEDVEIIITGNGVDLGSPQISVNPPNCDFGDVGVGVTAFCDLTIDNVGERDLELTSIGFSSDTNTTVFGSATVLPIPTFVAPGTGLSLRLFAEPIRPETFTGQLIIGSTDPDNVETFINLSVNGAQAPTAVAEIDSVNGTPANGPLTQVQPLDDVVVTGENSAPATPGGSIVGYAWELVEKPPESSVVLGSPNAMTTGFTFESGFTTVNGIDVAGTFVVRLTVTDNNGLVSTNDARVSINSIPSDALHFQLTWDSASNDLDMHVKKTPGEYCDSTLSCYYVNCREDDFSRPEFDGVGDSNTPGDPVLDIDDLSGFGPENINIDQPVGGTYRAAVHVYSFSATTIATMKIFVNGALREELFQELTADDQHWEVAQVDWNAGAGVVTPIGTLGSSGTCGN